MDSELLSIISLMDDPDSSVRNAVMERLISRGEKSLDMFERYIETEIPDGLVAEHKNFIKNVREKVLLSKLNEFLESKDHILSDGLFLVSKLIDPYADEDKYHSCITGMAADIVSEMSDEKTDLENIGIFNYFFFKRIGFLCVDYFIEKAEGTIVTRVLETKKGNPVSISIIYFLLARAVGMEIHPLCFPGGFVPVFINDKGAILFYLNIFKGGSIFIEESLVECLKNLGITYASDDVRIEDDIALVSIYAELLSYLYRSDGKGDHSMKIEKVLSLLGDKRFL